MARRHAGPAFALLLASLLVPGASRAANTAAGPDTMFSFCMVCGVDSTTGLHLQSDLSVNPGAGRHASAAGNEIAGGWFGQFVPTGESYAFATQPVLWTFASFPLRRLPSSLGSVLGDLGVPDTVGSWKAGRFSAIDTVYRTRSDTTSTVLPGEGYFLITRGAKNITLSGQPMPLDTVAIDLAAGPANGAGWNMVGNPFPFPIDVSELTVRSGGTVSPFQNAFNPFTANVAYAMSLVSWNNAGVYRNAAGILPGEGFWVQRLANVTGTVQLLVPPHAVSVAIPVAGGPAKPDGVDWAVVVQATQGARGSEPFLVGTAPVAAGARNVYCQPAAPEPPGGALRVLSRQAAWGGASGDYLHVFAPSGERSFDFELRGAQAPGEVQLSFAGLDVPAGSTLELADLRSGSSRAVPIGGSTRLTATAAVQSYRLVVHPQGDATQGGAPITDGLRFVYPNPFHDRAGFSFTLARAGGVVADAFDLSGRHVRSYALRGAGPGEHVWVWAGDDGAGRPLASGVYLVRWRAGGASGSRRVVIIR